MPRVQVRHFEDRTEVWSSYRDTPFDDKDWDSWRDRAFRGEELLRFRVECGASVEGPHEMVIGLGGCPYVWLTETDLPPQSTGIARFEIVGRKLMCSYAGRPPNRYEFTPLQAFALGVS